MFQNIKKSSKLWGRFEKECQDVKEISRVEELCKDAIEIMKCARDTFPYYTLHDMNHISNVIQNMEKLIGDEYLARLSLGECEMLLLAACYHDIGMCFTQKDREKELESSRFKKYLHENPSAWLKAVEFKEDPFNIPSELKEEFFRSIHPYRIGENLVDTLELKNVRRDYLVKVCQSHGEGIEKVQTLQYDSYSQVDCVFCAVILRLADILDFDMSRTPTILYQFLEIKESYNIKTKEEWDKHMAAQGFQFNCEGLSFRANCANMQVEKIIQEFLDHIENELQKCKGCLSRFGSERFRKFQFPSCIKREIEREGYQAEEYCLTLDAERVFELLIGTDLYNSDKVFIRELLQNSFDAIYAKELFSKCGNVQHSRIFVNLWFDEKGTQWFRIDDNGIGMTKQTIQNYFLKVGRSYYNSEEFKVKQYINRQPFQPISKFGIGILSCFLAGESMEVSTRHYENGDGIRFSMPGIKGFYSIAIEEEGDKGWVMPTNELKKNEFFRQSAGTSIAIKLKKSFSGNIEDLLKKYVCYPTVEVCYKDGIEWKSMMTEKLLYNIVDEMGNLKILLPSNIMEKIAREMPYLQWYEQPSIDIKSLLLENLSNIPYVKGADFEIGLNGKHNGNIKAVFEKINIIGRLDVSIAITKKAINVEMLYSVELFESNGLHNTYSLMEIWNKIKTRSKEAEEYARRIESGENIKEVSCDASDMMDIWYLMQMKGKKASFQIPFTIHESLEKLMKSIILPRCMSKLGAAMNNIVEFAFNGIWFSSSAYSAPVYEEGFRYTVVLLSGDFQPVLDVSRNSVKHLPIEAAAYIELLGKGIKNILLACPYDYYRDLKLKDYERLLENEKLCNLFEERKEIKHGVPLKLAQKELLEEHRSFEVYLQSLSTVEEVNDWHMGSGEYFLGYFWRAYLQKKFDVRWKKNKNGCMEYVIVGVRNDEINRYEELNIPLMFIKSLKGDKNVLTEEWAIGRTALNADHPFSEWFLEMSPYLYENYYSIYVNIVQNLRESSAYVMIDEVNRLLQELEKNLELKIPENVYLKADDYIYLYD